MSTDKKIRKFVKNFINKLPLRLLLNRTESALAIKKTCTVEDGVYERMAKKEGISTTALDDLEESYGKEARERVLHDFFSCHGKYPFHQFFERWKRENLPRMAAEKEMCKIFWNEYTRSEKDGFVRENYPAMSLKALSKLRDNSLKEILENKNLWANPIAFLEEIKVKRPDCVYETDQNTNFEEVLKKYDVKPGALIIVDLNNSTKNKHAQRPNLSSLENSDAGLYFLSDNETTPQYINFDNTWRGTLKEKYRCGYVVDLAKILREDYENKIDQVSLKKRLLWVAAKAHLQNCRD